MNGFEKVITVLIILMVIDVYILIKNDNTGRKTREIIGAIHKYNINQIENGHLDPEEHIKYSSMEPYERTLWRVWDWGHSNIVDKETFEKIRPYLRGDQSENKSNESVSVEIPGSSCPEKDTDQ